ncbi:MAG: YerC/YecD family TrpR-related protein [Candidatus Shapirobacteria bacterium]
MRVSQKSINPTLNKQLFCLLYQAIDDLKDPAEVEIFFKDLLAKTELQAMMKRLAVAYYLDKGRSYQHLKQNLKVSSATIATISRQMAKRPGYFLALKKIKADEWAGRWAGKLTALTQKLSPKK